MAKLIKTCSIAGYPTLEITGDLALTAEARSETDAIWAAALVARPRLFDGPVLTVLSISGNHFRLARASYRHVVAARRSALVRELLQLRPLAVSGVLTCPQGLVLGRRGREVTQRAGLWELAPSGGVEASSDGTAPNLLSQILKELEEETGLRADQASAGAPVGTVEDTESGVIDIVIPLTTDMPAARILAAHRNLGSSEYDELKIAAISEIRGVAGLLPESKAILETWVR